MIILLLSLILIKDTSPTRDELINNLINLNFRYGLMWVEQERDGNMVKVFIETCLRAQRMHKL